MTVKEQQKLENLAERTVRMEERQESMAEDIKDIKELLKAQDQKFAKFVEASEKKFVTRLETTAITVFISAAVSLVVLWINITGKH